MTLAIAVGPAFDAAPNVVYALPGPASQVSWQSAAGSTLSVSIDGVNFSAVGTSSANEVKTLATSALFVKVSAQSLIVIKRISSANQAQTNVSNTFLGSQSFAGPGTPAAPAVSIGPGNNNGFYWDPAVPGLGVAVQGRPQVMVQHDVDLNILIVQQNWHPTKGGPILEVRNNFSGPGAAGVLLLSNRGAVKSAIWVHSGLLRIGPTPPTADDVVNHTSGTVIGDQTSALASKDIITPRVDTDVMLNQVCQTNLYDFKYKDGRYNDETFTGVVTDEAPWIGKDHNRSLNEINGFGYLIGSIRELTKRLETAEARVKELESKNGIN